MTTPIRHILLATTTLAGAMEATPTWAQDATAGTTPAGVQSQESAPPAEEASAGDIVVTGTLISDPNLVASAPVTVVGQEEIQLRQSNTAEEILRDLPGAVPSIGSAVNNGNGGASFVDLRGLGSFRNVVLLDGQRIAPSGLIGRVDLNNIPLALVERVDTLTGGAATTYGADAVSGVVNFITRSDFSGIEAAVSNQLTEDGDGNFVRADITIGANFDDGRGNAVFSVGYQQSDPVYQGERSISVFNIDSFTGEIGGSSTAVPSSVSGTRPIDPVTGLPSVIPGFTGAVDAEGNPVANPLGFTNNGNSQINPATGLAGSFFSLFNFNPYNIFQTPFERFNLYGAGRYEVADRVEVYTRGLFSKNTVKTIVAPSGAFGAGVNIPLSNPFLPAALRSQFCAFNVAPADPVLGVQTTYTPRFTPAQCAAAALATDPSDPNFRTVQVNISRRTTELGPRISNFETTIFDYRAGVRIDVTDTINLDVGGSYGESQNTQRTSGYSLNSRLRAALYATSPTECLASGPGRGAAGNIAGVAGCVPANLFGPEGSITPEAAAFLTAESTITNRTSLAQARALLSGDFGASSPFADTPIGFALGAEYRKYRASQRSDSLAQSGDLGGFGSAPPNIDGGYEVYEGYAELIAPIVEDRPFFRSLTLEAGVRYSDYKIFAAGSPSFNTTTWKAGGSWEPVDGVKVRGNYQRAVRAPNINELFAPNQTGLTNLATDPCAGLAPVQNANLRAVCLAQGAPADTIGSIVPDPGAQPNATSGGNINLKPEKADSYTVGVVLQPRQLVPGLSVTVDYYHIKINDAVSNPLPGDALNACFGNITAASATDPACTVIRRNPVTGNLFGDTTTTPGLFLPLSNLGTLKTDGIDLGFNYRRDLGFAKLNLSVQGNWTNSSKFKATPTALNRECVGYYSVNCLSIQPEFFWNARTTLTFGNLDVSLLWRHIDKVRYEPAQAADSGPAFVGTIDGKQYDFNRIPSYDYFDLATRFGVNENLDLTITVQNLFNKAPPLVGNTIGSTTFNSGNTYPSTYDALGRRYAVGARIKF